MWFLLAIVVLLVVGLVDGHIASITAMMLLFVMGLLSVNTRKNKLERDNGARVFGIVFSIYMISAFIASQSFLNGQFFYVSDSMKYLEVYSDVSVWSWSETFQHLSQTYFNFTDDNGLYNESLAFWAYIANHYCGGTSVFYMTLLQTGFGLLASLEIFKIFLFYFEPSRSAKYTLVFALLSLFHIYSIVIIRDIIIAFFYMLGLRKVIGKPKITDGFVLLFIIVVTMGIRLYTGLFFGVFAMFWLFKVVKSSKYAQYRIVIAPVVLIGIAFVGLSVASSLLMESTSGQIGMYDELYSEESGIASRLRSLPVGIRQISILFFTQLPLDNFSRIYASHSFSNLYLSVLVILYKVFGFVVFYGLLYYCFIRGQFKMMSFNEKWLLIIMLFFMALNLSTHIDVRRSMEAVPIFYLLYMFLSDKISKSKRKAININLVILGIIIMISFAAIS